MLALWIQTLAWQRGVQEVHQEKPLIPKAATTATTITTTTTTILGYIPNLRRTPVNLSFLSLWVIVSTCGRRSLLIH